MQTHDPRVAARARKHEGPTSQVPVGPVLFELRGQDLNLRPLGYEPNELPDCSTPRQLCPRLPGEAESDPAIKTREGQPAFPAYSMYPSDLSLFWASRAASAAPFPSCWASQAARASRRWA